MTGRRICRGFPRSVIFRIRSCRGSSTVFLAMAFVAFAVCIAGSVIICRKLTVMSECEAYGRVWTKAILSEYDVYLMQDYKLMAYWGNEIEVNDRIDAYLDYSASGRLDARLGLSQSDLAGYELGDPDNFRTALEKGFASMAGEYILTGTGRRARKNSLIADSGGNENEGDFGVSGSDSTGRVIGNTVVLDTLPSGGAGSSFSTDKFVERARSARDEKGVRSAAADAGIELAFMWTYFNSCVTTADEMPHYLYNELEYVIGGKPDDHKNYESCRKKIFLMRNVLNLASLYKDPVKTELLTAAAQLITPGPLGAATQVILAEAWAAAETENDLKILYDNGRVPVIKTSEQWQTDLESVLRSSAVRNKLDEESRQLLDENGGEIHSLPGIGDAGKILTEGLSYDDHLILMILCMNSNTRILRVMDIVQINMKYRYYRDFNLMEYYTGVRFGFTANGRSYVFEDSYK